MKNQQTLKQRKLEEFRKHFGENDLWKYKGYYDGGKVITPLAFLEDVIDEVEKDATIKLEAAVQKEREEQINERREYCRYLQEMVKNSETEEKLIAELKHFILKEEEHLGL